MKHFTIGLVLLATATLNSGCQDGDGSGTKGSSTCSSFEGSWEGDEIDPYGDVRGNVLFVVRNDKIKATISEDETYTLTVTCNESSSPKKMTGTVTASSYTQAVGQRFYVIYKYEGNVDTVKLSGLKPGATTYPTTFSSGNGQRLFDVHRKNVNNRGVAGVGGRSGSGGLGDAGGSKADSGSAGKSDVGGSGDNGGSVTINGSYTINGDGTVTDKSTDLMWTRCATGISGSDCADGKASGYRWQAAVDYCDTLEFSGYDDWRLPEIHELESIVDHTRSAPAIEPSAFPATPSDWFWSSSSDVNYTAYPWAWEIHFSGGYVAANNKAEISFFVRCVRGKRWELGSFGVSVISGERIVEDSATGLIWQGCAAGLSGNDCAQGTAATYTWQSAIDFCDTLLYAGYDDWRLPDIRELLSIVDYTRSGPAIDPTAFSSATSGKYWSSLSDVNRPDNAKIVESYGYLSSGKKTDTYKARCVRGRP